MIPLFLLSGFFIPAKECPYYFLPFQYLSWFYYGTENMLINQWTVSKVCISLDITQGKIFFSCHKFVGILYTSVPKNFFLSVPGTQQYPTPEIFSIPCSQRYPTSEIFSVPGTQRYPRFWNFDGYRPHADPWTQSRFKVSKNGIFIAEQFLPDNCFTFNDSVTLQPTMESVTDEITQNPALEINQTLPTYTFPDC